MQWTTLWVIDRSDTIIHINDEYRHFAIRNKTPQLADSTLGRSLWDFITGHELTMLYRSLLDRLRSGRGPFELPYRCDSPTQRRKLLMRISGPDASMRVLFASETLEVTDRPAVDILDATIPRSCDSPVLRVCSWTNRIATPRGWLEVEDAIEELRLFELPVLPRISHGLCEEALSEVSGQILAMA
ncbi:MAG: hypothetical protein ACLFUJ_02160 [Phycisphaerae bacterium]